MNSLNFEQGDIVIAQLLYSEQIGLKVRPGTQNYQIIDNYNIEVDMPDNYNVNTMIFQYILTDNTLEFGDVTYTKEN